MLEHIHEYDHSAHFTRYGGKVSLGGVWWAQQSYFSLEQGCQTELGLREGLKPFDRMRAGPVKLFQNVTFKFTYLCFSLECFIIKRVYISPIDFITYHRCYIPALFLFAIHEIGKETMLSRLHSVSESPSFHVQHLKMYGIKISGAAVVSKMFPDMLKTKISIIIVFAD